MLALSPTPAAPQNRLGRLAASALFQSTILVVIVLNALVLGLETYDAIDDRYGELLAALDVLFFAVFVVELAIRIGAYGRYPWRFFKEPWNIFDFTIVAAVFIPGLREQTTVLRILRLLRVTRLIRVLPEVQVLLRGIQRSLQPIGGLVLLTFLLLYVYAMAGWALFSEQDPEHWGDVGESMLTLFGVLTLEGWIDLFEQMRGYSDFALPYLLSFILLGVFIVLNLVIGIVLTSMEEARAAHRLQANDPDLELRKTIGELRGQLEDLERRLDRK